MKLNDLSKHTSRWFSEKGPMSEIIISSRIRLARNLAKHDFFHHCGQQEKSNITEKLRNVLMDISPEGGMTFFDLDRASKLDRDFLVERHLISTHHARAKGARGVVVGNDELFAAMINEEDHLRMQVLMPGLQLDKCWETISHIDNQVEKKVEYAFNPELGYLTACPTNVGTGIRVSVMVHLPALKLINQTEKLFKAARDMNLAVRGLFGEGTEAVGDFFQISNQVTLGVSEEDTISSFSQTLIPSIVKYEQAARAELMDKKPDLLNDKIFRALGLLKSAQLVSSQEALFLLSHIRMGVNMKRIDSVSIDTINRLFLLTQPAHLQMSEGHELDTETRDSLRARIIRSNLSKN